MMVGVGDGALTMLCVFYDFYTFIFHFLLRITCVFNVCTL